MAMLRNQNLLPGRRILQEGLDAKFRRMMDAGISNLYELKNSLSTPKKLSEFSAQTAIPEEWLVILKREMGSLEQKPVPLSGFPGVSEQTILKLSEINVKTSKDFYNLCRSDRDTEAITKKTGINEEELLELSCLCNLVRINGVGAVAARTMYESGYKSVAEIAHAKAKELLERISETNSVRQYYKAKLGEKDMQFVIDFANIISHDNPPQSSIF
jgi:hypothetical protein